LLLHLAELLGLVGIESALDLSGCVLVDFPHLRPPVITRQTGNRSASPRFASVHLEGWRALCLSARRLSQSLRQSFRSVLRTHHVPVAMITSLTSTPFLCRRRYRRTQQPDG
jgi:hypothetical protein